MYPGLCRFSNSEQHVQCHSEKELWEIKPAIGKKLYTVTHASAAIAIKTDAYTWQWRHGAISSAATAIVSTIAQTNHAPALPADC